MNKLLLTTLLTLSFSAMATEPFGVKMGEPASKYKEVMVDGVGSYQLPKPLSDFKYYFLNHTEKSGICSVKAISKVIETSSYGTELVSKYEVYKGALSSKYEQSTDDYEFLRVGSVWNKPKDFMMSLLKKERIHSTIFKATDGTTIVIDALAFDRDEGVVTINYKFTNYDECLKAARSKTTDSL